MNLNKPVQSDIAVASYAVLASWGYSFDEAKHEAAVELFFAQNAGCKIEQPKAFVCACLRNREISNGRLLATRNQVYTDDVCELAFNDSIDEIEKLIKSLDENKQNIIRLRFVLGCSLSEIAAVTGLKLGTVKSRLSRAIEILKNKVCNNGYNSL